MGRSPREKRHAPTTTGFNDAILESTSTITSKSKHQTTEATHAATKLRRISVRSSDLTSSSTGTYLPPPQPPTFLFNFRTWNAIFLTSVPFRQKRIVFMTWKIIMTPSCSRRKFRSCQNYRVQAMRTLGCKICNDWLKMLKHGACVTKQTIFPSPFGSV
jgi:hypothetical protein